MTSVEASDALRAAFFRDAPDAVLAVDKDGRIIDANDEVRTVFGYEPEDLVGEPIERLLPKRARVQHEAHRARYLSKPVRRPMGAGLELWALRKDGTEIPVDVSLSPAHVSDAVVTVAAVRDVTDRRRAEYELRRWADVFQHAKAGIAVSSADGARLEFVNMAYARMHGSTPDELVGTSVFDLFVPQERARYAAHLNELAARGHHSFESLHVRRDGTVFPVSIDATVVEHGDGRLRYRVASVIDITDRLAAERALIASQERFRAVFDDAPIGIAVIDDGLRLVEANEALCRMLGYDRAELVGRHLGDLTPPEDARRDETLARRVLAGELARFHVEKRYATATGRVVWVAVRVSALSDPSDGGETKHALLMVEDVTERKESESRLEHLATHDDLTGLVKRSVLTDRLQQAISRAGRTGQLLGVLFADLDGFKRVNDQHGHEAGDAVLREVGRRIREATRPADTAARVGGDEFVVLCEDLGTDREEAECAARDVIERIQDSLRTPVEAGGVTVRVGVSIGTVVTRDHPRGPAGIIAAADAAMYLAKGMSSRHVVADSGS